MSASNSIKKLVRNKVTEKDIRDHLSANGFFGRTVEFFELELHAIQRPGWIQVFRFHIRAKHSEFGWQELFGVVRDDERRATDIHFFTDAEDRNATMTELSQDLISLEMMRDQSSPLVVLAVGLTGLVMLGLIIAIVTLVQ